MSGARGAPRDGKVKIGVKVIMPDTGRKVYTHLFMPKRHSLRLVEFRLWDKFGKKTEIVHLKKVR